MALETTGLTVATFETILDEIILEQQQNISSAIDVSDNTALGHLNKIFANQLASNAALLQDIYDQRDITAAEGKALDDLVTLIGLSRQAAQATSGETTFTGFQGINIPAGTTLRNQYTQDTYTVDLVTTLDIAACRDCIISVFNVINTQLYTLTIAGTNYTYTSDGSATNIEIITGLKADIDLSPPADITITDNLDGTLSINHDLESDLAVAIDSNLKVDEVTSAGNITCTEKGVLLAPANTITEIITPVSGVSATNNPVQLVQGRDVETDNELRARALNFRLASGTATVDSMLASLANISGVTSVAINEQYYSDGVGGNGQPAGSIQIVITGGDDDEIAQVIWDTKPAGVEVWGDSGFSTGNASDYAGNVVVVEFNRPTARPITSIVVGYKVFDTAVYPSTDAEAFAAIKTAIATFGNNLAAGEDVDPTEFEGTVYAAVGGIYQVSITMEGDTIVIPILSNEQATFSESDITVSITP
jgi:uncharacterized phage protein gp47/JayE